MPLPPITPSIGRKVWYWQKSNTTGQAEDATVVFVHSENCVNLRVTDHNGDSRPVQYCHLRQPGEIVSEDYLFYCEWMPFQVSQAAKYAVEVKPETLIDTAVREVQEAAAAVGALQKTSSPTPS